MYPSCQPQVVWGNQQYSTVAQGLSNRSDGNLWGSNVRRIMGILQIVCGVLEFAFGVAVICVPLYYVDSVDYIGWGLWNGIFATVTGFLGVYSKKKKGMVVSYMVTSIIASVMAAACCCYAGIRASDSRWPYDGYRRSNLAMYIILCIVFFIQMVISIIGASFTCNVVCSPKNQSQHIVYYYTPLAQTQQDGPAPPYAVVAGQQFNAPQNTQNFQSTTSNNQPQQFVPAPTAPLVAAQQFNAPQSTQSFQGTTDNTFGTSQSSKI